MRFRYSAVAALVGLALVAGSPAAVASRGTPPDRNCRPATWIQGAVENRTDARLVLAQEGFGPGTEWCRSPGDDVRAHATDQWRVGDDAGKADVFLIYLLDNGDRVRFRARAVENGPVEVSCSIESDATTPLRRYRCEAENVMGADHFAFVRLSVLPVRG